MTVLNHAAIVSVTVDPLHLEDVLECLAELNVPIDPTIHHGPETVVKFSTDEPSRVRRYLQLAGFLRVSVQPII